MANLRFLNARQVIEAFPNLKDEITSPDLDLEPFAFIGRLLQERRSRQALAFCAFVLPRHEAVQWLCRALRSESQLPSGPDERLLRLAEEWVKAPVESARRAALDGGMDDPQKGACAWAALAAGWCGGNLSSNAEQPVPPPAHLTGHAAMVGMTLLVARYPLGQQVKKIEDLVGSAIALLKHGKA